MPTDPIRTALERLLCLLEPFDTSTLALGDAITDALDALAAEPPDPAGGGEALLAAAPLEGEEPTTEELNRLYREIYGLRSDVLGPMPRKFARAVLARWGRPAAPADGGAGELGKLVAWLCSEADIDDGFELTESAAFQRRAAALLEQQAAADPA